MMFSSTLIQAAMDHAKEQFPKESCGLLVDNGYIPCENIAHEKETAFEIKPEDFLPHMQDGTLKAVIHSHPSGREGPSARDIATQIEMNVPFGIIVFRGGVPIQPYFWGPGVPIPPLLQRRFRHGPSGTDGKGDCYAAIKDWYALEKKIVLPEFPRSDQWWAEGMSLYKDGFEKAGFACLHEGPDFKGNLHRGAVILFKFVGKVPHHGAVYLGGELIYHHLADTERKTRLSKNDPLSRYRGFATHWLRYNR